MEDSIPLSNKITETLDEWIARKGFSQLYRDFEVIAKESDPEDFPRLAFTMLRQHIGP